MAERDHKKSGKKSGLYMCMGADISKKEADLFLKRIIFIKRRGYFYFPFIFILGGWILLEMNSR